MNEITLWRFKGALQQVSKLINGVQSLHDAVKNISAKYYVPMHNMDPPTSFKGHNPMIFAFYSDGHMADDLQHLPRYQ